MNAIQAVRALLVLGVLVRMAASAEPETISEPTGAVQDQQPPKVKPPVVTAPIEKEKKTPDTKPAAAPQDDVFAQTPTTGGQVLPFFNPHMLGDFSTYFARQTQTFVTYRTTTTTTTAPGDRKKLVTRTVTVPIAQSRTVLISIPTRGAFNIAENESPRPQDRVFFTYNGFSDIQGPVSSPPVNTTTTSQSIATGAFGQPIITKTTTSTVIPGVPSVSLNRQVFGFEKTLLDGNASVELRVPILQQTGTLDSLTGANVGDLTIVGKYALFLDRTTGNVFSMGMALTAPTGPGIPTINGTIHSTLLQPFVGYIWNSNQFYFQAFHSVVTPTDPRDVTLLFNDASVNYWLYRNPSNRWLRFVVPLVEAHVTTPLNHRGLNEPLIVPDLVVMTGGVHFGLFKRSTLTLGVATPVTGPPPFGVEGFLQLNWFY